MQDAVARSACFKEKVKQDPNRFYNSLCEGSPYFNQLDKHISEIASQVTYDPKLQLLPASSLPACTTFDVLTLGMETCTPARLAMYVCGFTSVTHGRTLIQGELYYQFGESETILYDYTIWEFLRMVTGVQDSVIPREAYEGLIPNASWIEMFRYAIRRTVYIFNHQFSTAKCINYGAPRLPEKERRIRGNQHLHFFQLNDGHQYVHSTSINAVSSYLVSAAVGDYHAFVVPNVSASIKRFPVEDDDFHKLAHYTATVMKTDDALYVPHGEPKNEFGGYAVYLPIGTYAVYALSDAVIFLTISSLCDTDPVFVLFSTIDSSKAVLYQDPHGLVLTGQYVYRLGYKSVTHAWLSLGKSQKYNIPNLPPGTYTGPLPDYNAPCNVLKFAANVNTIQTRSPNQYKDSHYGDMYAVVNVPTVLSTPLWVLRCFSPLIPELDINTNQSGYLLRMETNGQHTVNGTAIPAWD